MTQENAKPELDTDLVIAKEAAKMKDQGANQTQIREFLESKGWSGIQFHTDDKGAPGIEPKTEIPPAMRHPQLEEVVKLVAEIIENNFLPEIAAKALQGIEFKQIGGVPGTCWTCVFQNEKYELDVVYYPSEETYAVCVTSRKDRFDVPKLGKRITFDKLKDTIHDTVLKYIF